MFSLLLLWKCLSTARSFPPVMNGDTLRMDASSYTTAWHTVWCKESIDLRWLFTTIWLTLLIPCNQDGNHVIEHHEGDSYRGCLHWMRNTGASKLGKSSNLHYPGTPPPLTYSPIKPCLFAKPKWARKLSVLCLQSWRGKAINDKQGFLFRFKLQANQIISFAGSGIRPFLQKVLKYPDND